MSSSRLTTKGRITLPKEVRDQLNIKAGARIDFAIDEAGHVLLVPARSRLEDLWGMLRVQGRNAVSIEEMDEAIEREQRPR